MMGQDEQDGQDEPGKQDTATTRPTSQPDLHTCMRVSADGRALSSGSRPPFRWERLKNLKLWQD